MNALVEFQGNRYWYLEENGSGPLAYFEHCDEHGNINSLESACSDSFAHVLPNGDIMRYRKIIGNREDLRFIKE